MSRAASPLSSSSFWAGHGLGALFSGQAGRQRTVVVELWAGCGRQAFCWEQRHLAFFFSAVPASQVRWLSHGWAGSTTTTTTNFSEHQMEQQGMTDMQKT